MISFINALSNVVVVSAFKYEKICYFKNNVLIISSKEYNFFFTWHKDFVSVKNCKGKVLKISSCQWRTFYSEKNH